MRPPVRALALAGYGVGLCFLPTVSEDVAAGRLLRLLEAHEAYDRSTMRVYRQSRCLPAKLRAFLDHLADHFGPGPDR
jgi:DNA-binding transcriptional LysR family regulator